MRGKAISSLSDGSLSDEGSHNDVKNQGAVVLRVRPYESGEASVLITLFRETVHTVAARDYGAEELAAWAPDDLDPTAWDERLARHPSFVAVDAERVVGFAELAASGHVHMLYVAKDRQREGIANALMDRLEGEARRRQVPRLTTDASRTARPFFEARGFDLVRAQFVTRAGVRIENFRMEKLL
jgi:putative acetyltransferase